MATLGAAKITPAALVKPARDVPGVEVTAVAARNPDRARAFAAKHGIPRVLDSYEAVIEDPDVDAVYNPLPNGLHGRWTLAALAAGKHVLCEKPFTANRDEAVKVAAAAAHSDRAVMEAFHWRYHPLAQRMLDVIGSGTLGSVSRIETKICFPLPMRKDIRYQLDLAGGATMDAGCYAIHILRTLAGTEPRVLSAQAKLMSPGVDRAMTAEMAFSDGRTGAITCSMWSTRILSLKVTVTGDRGRMDVLNPLAPHRFNRLTIRSPQNKTSERVRGDPTYTYQLRAFDAAVRDGTPALTGPDDAVANMAVIDDVYRAAGLEPRPAS